MSTWVLAWRFLGRDWRAGELNVLVAALLIAVAGITSVNFFTDRVQRALETQANDLLGGDLVLQSSEPVSAARIQAARDAGLRHALTIEFPTMVMAGEKSQLSALKVVSQDYPLRGQHRVAMRLFAPDDVRDGGPARGTLWADSRLLTLLNIDVGDTVAVGASMLTVAAVLTAEPDQSEGTLFNIAPRLLMHADDLAATRLVQPASRVQYRLLLSGNKRAIERMRAAWASALGPGEKLLGVEDARPEVRTALARGERFLGLASLVSVLLAGAAIALATRRYVSRHLDHCAVMRCLGAEQAVIVRLYRYQMLMLGLMTCVPGIAAGYLAQLGLVYFLGPLAGIELPQPGIWPVLWGFLTGMVTLLGFAVPPVMQLANVPTLRVLRRDLGPPQPNVLWASVLGLGAFFLLVIIQAGNVKLALTVLGGLLLLIALLALLAMGLLAVLSLVPRGSSAWRLGLNNLARRPRLAMIQMTGFSIGMMALLLLVVVRSDLLDEWQNRLPEDTPNRFLINIQPDQLGAVQEFFRLKAVQAPLLYPMVRGRLTGINGQTVSEDAFATDRARRLVMREFNLSWAADLQADNQITGGKWWTPTDPDKRQFSVEEGLAKELGLKLGDTLTYSMSGQEVTARITSLRSVKWDSFRANFFVIAPPGWLDAYPNSYITGFHLPSERHGVMNELVARFPNITVLDVNSILEQVRTIIQRVIQAVEYVFLFTLFAGITVLYASLYATFDERIREAAILRTLGARRGQILGSIMIEYASLGLLSGLVAAIAAGLVGMAVAQRMFDLDYVPGPDLWVGGMLAGMLCIGLAGLLGTRAVVNHPPLQTLRNQ